MKAEFQAVLEKYGFVSEQANNPYLIRTFNLSVSKRGWKAIVHVLYVGEMFSISVVIDDDDSPRLIANRYKCETAEELEFLLTKGYCGRFLPVLVEA